MTTTASPILPVIGYGALGQEIVQQLRAADRVIQRSRTRDLPPGAEFVAADIRDPSAITAAIAGANTAICALGLSYFAKLWETGWPLAMTNLLSACEAQGARLGFADNLYLYGPQSRPLTEDLTPVDYCRKPKARAEVTRLWQAAYAAGRVKVAAVRSSDFYGLGVVQSVLGVASLQALVEGKTARPLSSADLPHEVAVVIVVLALDGCSLDRSVHPLDLAVGPGVLRFGRPVLNAKLSAGIFKGVRPDGFALCHCLGDQLRRRSAGPRRGEMYPVVDQYARNPIGTASTRCLRKSAAVLRRALR